jgi:hypothetical protein
MAVHEEVVRGDTRLRASSDVDEHVRSTRVFSTSILVSAVRCTLTYVVFPWILPVLGVAGGVGPAVGVVIGVIALASNVASIRRFWVSRHRWRWPITVINGGVMVLLVILLVQDIGDL